MTQLETSSESSWTIQRVLMWSTDYLRDRHLSDTPRLDAELLLSHALGVTRIHLYTHFDKPLTPPEREPFKQFLMRRGSGEPVAYITGAKEFMGLSFKVSRAVLIPRPDTEIVVETAMGFVGALGRPAKILDVGTGSGCIAISLGLKFGDATVEAWEVAADTLALARANAERLGARNVALHARDALDPQHWEQGETFDLIVSNPPYIGRDEAPGLPKSVAEFEPHGALFADEDGLQFYRLFAERAAARLAPGGSLVVEIGATQAPAVVALFRSASWGEVSVKQDYAKNDRVVVASSPYSRGRP